jgi:CRP-like cAMP-binding protein
MKIQKNTFNKYVKEYTPDETIFREGDRGEEMYVIIQGQVEIRKTTSSKSTKTLITLKKGDIFGEMALIENKPRSAAAVSVESTQVLAMNEELFNSMLSKNPDFAKKMIRILSERLRKADLTIKNIMITNKQSQILDGLYQYADEYGTPTFKGHRVNIQKFIKWAADQLGFPPNELKINIDNLKKKNIVKTSALGSNEVIISQR